ncbi:MAG: DedA family protein [Myxococcales bacterium FL481]|nr:MAG: DedA family protein [Myxococcales bacterium FL481]
MSDESPHQADQHAELELRGLLWRTLLSASGVMTVVLAIAAVFHEALFATSRWFVETLGGPGILIGFFIPDAFTVPLPNDAFSTFGLLGGMGFWPVVAWGTVGSLLGGTTGYFIGRRLLGRSPRLQRVMTKRGGDISHKIQRGGTWLLAAAALTPIPYSIVCWAAGGVRMPFLTFLAISQLRLPRVAGWLWLIERGIITVLH